MTSLPGESFEVYYPEPSKHHHHRRHRRKKKKALKILLIIFLCLLVVFSALGGTFLVMRSIGRKQLMNGQGEIAIPEDLVDSFDDDGKTVSYNGEKYLLNEDIVSIVFMGVDKKDINQELGYGTNGQADAIFVACLDTKSGAVKIIPIPREFMVDVNLYSTSGKYVGVEREQLCLAYAYGGTPQESCNNVVLSVSRALYGMNMGSYVAIDLAGVGVLTDMVGGVTVTSPETISYGKYKFTQGQSTTLKGGATEAFIRARTGTVEGSTLRLVRQKEFLNAFSSKAGNQVLSNITQLPKFYNTAKPYTASDITLSELTYLASCVLTTDIGNSLKYHMVGGNIGMGEKYVEFEPDPTALFEMVLEVFYKKQ